MSATAPLINPLLASVVGLLVISAVVVVVVVAIAKYCIRRRRRSKVTRFGKLNSVHLGERLCSHYVSSQLRLVIIIVGVKFENFRLKFGTVQEITKFAKVGEVSH